MIPSLITNCQYISVKTSLARRRIGVGLNIQGMKCVIGSDHARLRVEKKGAPFDNWAPFFDKNVVLLGFKPVNVLKHHSAAINEKRGSQLPGCPLSNFNSKRLSENDLGRLPTVPHCSAHTHETEDHHAPGRSFWNRRCEADAATVRTATA